MASEPRMFTPPLGHWFTRKDWELGYWQVVGNYGSQEDAIRAANDLNRVTPRLSLPDSTVIHPESNEPQKP